MGYKASLQWFGKLLADNLDVSVCRNEALDVEPDFILWNETGSNRFYADNITAVRILLVDVEIFTAEEYPELPDKLEELLQANGVIVGDPEITYVMLNETIKCQSWKFECEVPMR